MGEWLLSRRDGAIVAWHEVPLQFGHLQGIRCEIAPTKGRHVSARGFNPKSANLMRGLSMGEWLLSRRDGAIVAWHEVPGTPPKRGPSRRVRCDSCRRAHRFDDWSDEISNTITKKILAWIHQTFLGIQPWYLARFRERSVTSSTSANIIGHQPFKKSI